MHGNKNFHDSYTHSQENIIISVKKGNKPKADGFSTQARPEGRPASRAPKNCQTKRAPGLVKLIGKVYKLGNMSLKRERYPWCVYAPLMC